jgi:hypothetical protein
MLHTFCIVVYLDALRTPASSPAHRWYTDDSGINQIVVAAWLLANADY